MKKKWRLILEGKGDGYYNMAVDEAIFLKYPVRKVPTLRIYDWAGPFISLGYNQNALEVVNKDERVNFVRRITGGAAIVHGSEITYSIACQTEDLGLPERVKESYKALSSFIKEFYSRLGLKAEFGGDIPDLRLVGRGNLCFSSCEEFDFTVGGMKIGGSAQRRKKKLIFQQGSIPRKIDFELIGRLIKGAEGLNSKVTFLDRILGRETDFFFLGNLLAESFESVFNVLFTEKYLLEEEAGLAEYLIDNKYRNKEWNYNKKEDVFQKNIL